MGCILRLRCDHMRDREVRPTAHLLTWDCGMQSSRMMLGEKYDGMFLFDDDDDEHRGIVNRSWRSSGARKPTSSRTRAHQPELLPLSRGRQEPQVQEHVAGRGGGAAAPRRRGRRPAPTTAAATTKFPSAARNCREPPARCERVAVAGLSDWR